MLTFSTETKRNLLDNAKWHIREFLSTGKTPSLPEKFKTDPVLYTAAGAFVTVYVGSKLRGCIGSFREQELYKSIGNLAIQAASQDSRFDPVIPDELEEMRLEISVLTPRKRISEPEEIEIGKHGIYLIHGTRHATLLPQVAVEHGYTKVEFLEVCARNKLGINKDSWKDSEIYVYEAFIVK